MFYTYFGSGYNDVLVSGYDEFGKKFNNKIKYRPTLFRLDKRGDGIHHTVQGKPLLPRLFDDIVEARSYANQYKESGQLFGLTNYPYVYIYETYKQIKFDIAKLRIGNIDIETDSHNGYGDAQLANREIISLTIKMFRDNKIYVLGRKPYQTQHQELVNSNYEIKYLQCADEKQLLYGLISIWNKLKIDIITNWNGETFDIPYILKRIEQVLGEEHAKKLSPFGRIDKDSFSMYGRTIDKWDIVGIPNMDFMQVYKKFSFGNEENYKLETIAAKILKVGKLDYHEHGYKSLDDLYQRNHNMFIDYNIIDVLRVEQLDNFLKFLEQIIMIAHFAKVNFADTFGTLRTWDIMIHNYLMDQNIAIPQPLGAKKEKQIAGAFVKQPVPGRYPNVMSFDLTSLYPHLVMMYNISPETLLGKFDPIAVGVQSVDKILDGELEQFVDKMVEHNVTVSGKGTVFSKDKIGFLPKLMQDLFQERKRFKKLMLSHEADAEAIKQELIRRGLNTE